ncbi:MAG: hypothetical protein SVU32_02720 [Candidatus Nanohaloarchaea archaeon]|nr:hypothetical protein [Candidatus Nanohaloarchaea archaeon]
MVDRSYEAKMKDERELLEDNLLEDLENTLSGYQVVDLSNEAEQELEDALQHGQQYELPSLEIVDRGGELFPEYFVADDSLSVDDVKDGDYAVAIEPEYKVVELQDDSIRSEVVDFAEDWEDQTNVTEAPAMMGKEDVSEVLLTE